jgi:hypothetical protein
VEEDMPSLKNKVTLFFIFRPKTKKQNATTKNTTG